MKKLFALIMIGLMVTLPIASAASVQITRNHGSAGVENYVNANGDDWVLEALVNSEAEVTPESVVLVAGHEEFPFDECTSGLEGATCTYSPERVPRAGSYDLRVQHLDASDTTILTSDGSAPDITLHNRGVRQEQRDVVLDFTVVDPEEGHLRKCVGLGLVEVSDEETGDVYLSESGFEPEDCSFSFTDKIPQSLTGHGPKTFVITAADRLGQETVVKKTVQMDFVAPVVQASSIGLGLGSFIGNKEITTRLTVNITEASALQNVVATSDQLNGASIPLSCTPAGNDVWECSASVRVLPEPLISISIEATDASGLVGTAQHDITLDKDETPPVIDSFTTARTFNGISYVQKGTIVLVAEITEQGAGLDPANIEANLAGLGFSGPRTPTSCEDNGGSYRCVWEVRANVGTKENVLVNLVSVKDNVGNVAESSVPLHIVVDDTPPVVQKVEMFGISAFEKDYFEGEDQLKIHLEVDEVYGLVIKVNLNEATMGAASEFPETELNDAGWKVLDQDDASCVRVGGSAWECDFVVDLPLLNTFQADTFVELIVEDTAGNENVNWPAARNVNVAKEPGRYGFTILGTDPMENPDLWELDPSKKITSSDFVDLEMTETLRSRFSATIPLRSKEPKATARRIEVVSCVADEEENAPPFAREVPLIYGTVTAQGAKPVTEPTIVLEYDVFDGKREGHFKEQIDKIAKRGLFKQLEVDYECTLQIFTEMEHRVTTIPEVEEIDITVTFAYSDVGSHTANLDEKIADIKDRAGFKYPNMLRYAGRGLAIAQYLYQGISFIMSLERIWAGSQQAWDTSRVYGRFFGGQEIATSTCAVGEKTIRQEGWGWIEKIQGPFSVLTCQPNPSGSSAYGIYQSGVLDVVNLYKGGTFTKSRSLYDDIYISTVGLCLPGVIHNLEKLRQINCQEMKCIKEDVASGRATLETCKKIYDIMECKYVKGERWAYVVPLTDLAAKVKEVIRNTLMNPVVALRALVVQSCILGCPTSGASVTFCNYVGFGIKVLDLIDAGVGIYQSYPTVKKNYCRDVGIDSL